MLFKYLKGALNDDFNKNWGLMLYNHPLIEALGREMPKSSSIWGFLQNNILGKRRRLPQYIPAEQFSKALIDLVIDHRKQASFIKNSEGLYQTVKEELRPEQSYVDFLAGLNSLQESEFKQSLYSLVRKASVETNPFLSLQLEINEWYNNSMDRLNGWYKRATRKWLFITGLLIAILFNLNALTILARLYTDPQLRSSVSQAATRYLEQNDTLRNTRIQNADSLRARINELRDIIQPLQLPIGYTFEKGDVGTTLSSYVTTIYEAIPANIIGWLLTAIAVSFGAPFWFDILKKFANLRSAGLSPTSGNSNSNKNRS